MFLTVNGEFLSRHSHSNSDPTNVMANLEAEMKLLHWHKLANASALQTALIRTKQMRQSEAKSRPVFEEEARFKRKDIIRRTIEEEKVKLLEVGTCQVRTRTKNERQK